MRPGVGRGQALQRPLVPWKTFGFCPVESEALQKDLQQGSDPASSVSGKLTHLLGKGETRDWLRGKCDSPDEMLKASARAWHWGWRESRFDRDSGSRSIRAG